MANSSHNFFWDWDTCPSHPGAYTESHKKWRAICKKFMDEEVIPNVDQWEEEGGFPKSLHETCYQAGMYGAFWPEKYGGTFPTEENHDMFHYFIFYDELARANAGGLYGSLMTHGISLGPILMLGSQAQKDEVVRDIITGKKTACLAVTEPGGGSDVANVKTIAKLDPSGKFYILNGQKTFISGGMNADFFTCGARTGDAGNKGISMFLVRKELPGVKCHRLKTQGWLLSTTTLVTFDDVKVPVSDLLGKEGDGFKAIMRNFNNERLGIAIMVNRQARVCLEDTVKYAQVRNTFGKPLISHQVIRHKVMECARTILSTHHFTMSICAQQKTREDQENSDRLAGSIALCKVQATKGFEFVARECSQIFGGKAYLRTGPGSNVERAYREVRVLAIGGGSEEIMLDLAARQAKL